jgi:isopenicillin-N epimerase
MNHAKHWDLEPGLVFLNHGSFGASPRVVLEEQVRLRAELEANPVRFMHRELEPKLDAARTRLADLVGADPEGLAFVPNATTGVNTALAALTGECPFDTAEPGEVQVGPGDEVLILDPEYNATANATRFAASRVGATVRVVRVPFPITDAAEVTSRVLDAVTKSTRLLVIDHIVSQTGLVLPVEDLVGPLRELGIETLIDGAHAPGQIPLDLDGLGAAFYTGNCHKWLCTPKGSALLHVREDWCPRTRPLVISHGANAELDGRSRFRHEFDWIGTDDPTPFLTIPAAIDFLDGLFPSEAGRLDGLMSRNRALAREGLELLASALEVEPPAPAAMMGALASLPLAADPPSRPTAPAHKAERGLTPLHLWLHDEHGIEVPVFAFPPHQVLRISAQAYNTCSEYERLANALSEWFGGHSPHPGPQ